MGLPLNPMPRTLLYTEEKKHFEISKHQDKNKNIVQTEKGGHEVKPLGKDRFLRQKETIGKDFFFLV